MFHQAGREDLGRALGRRLLLVTQQAAMHEPGMTEVEEVVGGLQIEIVAAPGPIGMIVLMEVGNVRRIGSRRIAHPDPEHVVALHQRIDPYPRGPRNVTRLGRIANAGAGAVEGQSVIPALDRVADEAAHRQRRKAMRASVGHRDRLAVFLAEEDDRLVEIGAREQLAADFMAPGGRVPAVAQKFHDGFLQWLAARAVWFASLTAWELGWREPGTRPAVLRGAAESAQGPAG